MNLTVKPDGSPKIEFDTIGEIEKMFGQFWVTTVLGVAMLQALEFGEHDDPADEKLRDDALTKMKTILGDSIWSQILAEVERRRV